MRNVSWVLTKGHYALRISPYAKLALSFYLLHLTFCVGEAWAKDEPLTDDEVVVKTEGSHRLLLPKDWPVEQRDGRIGPVPIEEYLSMKFGQVKEKFTTTDQRLIALEQRVQQLEDDRKALQVRVQRLETRGEEKEMTHGDSTQIR